MGECPVAEANVHVSECVDNVEEYKVGSDDHPVLSAPEEEGEEKGGTKCGNVDEMFLEVLYKGCGWEGVNGKMVESVHGLHVFWDVQPAVSEIIEGFYNEEVTPQGVDGTCLDE